MKKREPPQIGDLVCLTYNTNTIGIVTDIWNCHNTKYRYKVKWLKDQENILSAQNGTDFLETVMYINKPFYIRFTIGPVSLP